MANDKNLKPQNTRTKSEQREIAKKGGIASGEARRERKKIKDELILLLSNSDTQANICVALIKEALNGNVKAFQTIRDTVDGKPTEKLEVKPVETTWFQDNPFEDMTTEELKQFISNLDDEKEAGT